MIDGKQVKNKDNPTGTGKYLNESGQYVDGLKPINVIRRGGSNPFISHTGTTANTIISSDLIAANTFTYFSNDVFKFIVALYKSVSTASCTVRVYLNSSVSLTGATLLSTTTLTAALSSGVITRNIGVGNTWLYYYPPTTSAFHDYVGHVAISSQIALNVDNYFIVAIQLGIATDAISLNFLNVTK